MGSFSVFATGQGKLQFLADRNRLIDDPALVHTVLERKHHGYDLIACCIVTDAVLFFIQIKGTTLYIGTNDNTLRRIKGRLREYIVNRHTVTMLTMQI